MAQALYREWRPRNFDEIVEQEHIVSALKQAVIGGELGHAYLFTGTRGTGKTSMAKILARAVNCLHPHDGNPDNTCEICLTILNNTLTDVAEIDAASNNSVDNIRQITEEIVFLPARAKYKVYIIDEVHMLSTGAFNALLKTLEEPPAHAIFILATTEPHRLPATILSRCQRYDFKRISETSLASRLQLIANEEDIRIDAEAIRAISLLADGAMRDAISLLDQAKISFPNGATQADIKAMTGQVDRDFLGQMVTALIHSNATDVLLLLDRMIRDGQDMVRFAHELAAYYRDLLVIHAAVDTNHLKSGKLAGLIPANASEIDALRDIAGHYQQPEIVSHIKDLSTLISDMRWSPNPRIMLEIGILKLMGTRASEAATKAKSAGEQTAPIAPKPMAATPALEPKPELKPEPEPPAPHAQTTSKPVQQDDPYEDLIPPPYEDFYDAVYDDEPAGQVMPASKPVETVQAAPVTAATPATPAPPAADSGLIQTTNEAANAWAKILNRLQQDDMFTYMFAKIAKVDAEGGGLLIHFAAKDKAHYNVLSADRALTPLRKAILDSLGQMIPYRITMEGQEHEGTNQQTNSEAIAWQDDIARTAERLGIPIERKDE